MNPIKKIGAEITWRTGIGPLLRMCAEPKLLFLAYHSIDAKGIKPHLEISPEVFLRQLLYVKNRGYSFHQFSEASDTNGKSAFVYFDDGFRSVKEQAYPVLKRLGIPATFFLTTDYIDQKAAPGLYLSWNEILPMGDIFEFGSHGVTHRKLNKIPLGEAREEMRRSKAIIEEKTGRQVRAFSYPYGRSSRGLEEMAHALGYRVTTADTRFHKARPDPDDSFTVFKIKSGISWL